MDKIQSFYSSAAPTLSEIQAKYHILFDSFKKLGPVKKAIIVSSLSLALLKITYHLSPNCIKERVRSALGSLQSVQQKSSQTFTRNIEKNQKETTQENLEYDEVQAKILDTRTSLKEILEQIEKKIESKNGKETPKTETPLKKEMTTEENTDLNGSYIPSSSDATEHKTKTERLEFYKNVVDPLTAFEHLMADDLFTYEIISLANSFVPSRDPTQRNFTKKELISFKISQLASKINEIFCTFSDGLFNFVFFFDTIEQYPSKTTSLIFAGMASLAFQRVWSIITPGIEKHLGDLPSIEKRFGTIITIAIATMTVALFVIRRQIHSPLLVSLSEELSYKKIPYRNLDLLTKFRSFCSEIVSCIEKERSDHNSSILIPFENNEFGPVEITIQSLQEMAERGRCGLSKKKLEIYKLDINGLLASSTTKKELIREWKNLVHELENSAAIVWVQNFEQLLYPMIFMENTRQETDENVRYLALQLRDLIEQGKIRCIFATPIQQLSLFREHPALRGMFSKFQEVKVPIFDEKEIKEFLRDQYQPQDRWDFPQLSNESIDVLTNEIERQNIYGDFPASLTPEIETLIKDAAVEQKKLPDFNTLPKDVSLEEQHILFQTKKTEKEEWQKIRKGIQHELGKKLEAARNLFDKAFIQWNQICQKRSKGFSEQEMAIAKRLILLKRILIPLLKEQISMQMNSIPKVEREITPEHIYRRWKKSYKKLPTFSPNSEQMRLKTVQKELAKRVVGREEVLQEIQQSWITWRTNPRKKDDHRPAHSYFLSGPAGTGKSTLAEEIAQVHNKTFGIYSETQGTPIKSVYLPNANLDTSKGTNTFVDIYEFILNHPSGILVLEEIDKVDPKYLAQFLELLGPGTIKFKRGENVPQNPEIIVDRRNVTIILTANYGAKEFSKENNNVTYTSAKTTLEEMIRKNLGDHFLGRITNIFPFLPLSDVQILKFIQNVQEQQRKNHPSLEITFDKSFNDHYLQRAKELNGDLRLLSDEIRNHLTSIFDPYTSIKGTKILVTCEEKKLKAIKLETV